MWRFTLFATICFLYFQIQPSHDSIYQSGSCSRTTAPLLQYNLMRTQLDLPQAVERLFGNSLVEHATPASDWHSLVPYSSFSSTGQIYFKLLELPASFHTSEEICAIGQQKFGDVLHKVQVFFVERTFQSCWYLVKAQQNVLTLRSLIKLKRQAGENIEEELIFKYLEFVSLLEEHRCSSQISFNIDQIGLDPRGEFVLTNYKLYFRHPDPPSNSLNADSRKVLVSMLMLSETPTSLMDLYSRVNEEYGISMMTLVEKCMQSDLKTSEAMTVLCSTARDSHEVESRATLTDSYIDDLDRLEQTLAENSFSEGPSFTKIKSSKSKHKVLKLAFFSIVFLILLGGIGFVTLKYFKPPTCAESEYFDAVKKECLACASGCERCNSSNSNNCFSCKGDLFLIKPSYSSQLGRCGTNCTGMIIIGPKTCVDHQV